MTTKRAKKTALIGESILFTVDDPVFINRIDPNLSHNFVDVVSLDGAGNPVTPAAGDYMIYVKTNADGGFKALTDGGSLNAALTGGDSMADGLPVGASFGQNPIEIKVVPVGVDVALAYRVLIIQNLT